MSSLILQIVIITELEFNCVVVCTELEFNCGVLFCMCFILPCTTQKSFVLQFEKKKIVCNRRGMFCLAADIT